jgi:hypothetical protein
MHPLVIILEVAVRTLPARPMHLPHAKVLASDAGVIQVGRMGTNIGLEYRGTAAAAHRVPSAGGRGVSEPGGSGLPFCAEAIGPKLGAFRPRHAYVDAAGV